MRDKVKVIDELRQHYPFDELLQIADIPRSTFYYHLKALKALKAPDKYADLKCRIREIYNDNFGRYGYRRITIALKREACVINHKVIQRLMNVMTLKREQVALPVLYEKFVLNATEEL
ncbi:IS3 family transposase [Klebsiella huaxiensis]|uniref:IS3 family transposase n=1 Tax=Klebsiella huaxiensis TaxID=2153354 RepID=UPI003CCB8C37